MPTSDPTPADIAAVALAELGQTVSDDPIRQLNAYAHQLSELVQDMRERMHITNQLPADVDEYERTRDANLKALVAAVEVQKAIEVQELREMFGNPTHDPEAE